MNETRERLGHSPPSRTEKVRNELGNLYLAITFDEDDRPFEMVGWIGKTGIFGHGMAELVCRLLSLDFAYVPHGPWPAVNVRG